MTSLRTPSDISRSSQSIIIGIELSINKSIKIGKSDLIDNDCIDQSVEIDDTLVSFIDLSWFLPISSIYIERYICSSKNENWIHANSTYVCWQLSCNWESKGKTILRKSYLFFKTWVKNYLLLMADIGQVCRHPVYHDVGLSPFRNITSV